MYKVFVMILVLVLITSSVNHVYAVQLDAVIVKNSKEFTPSFQFTRIITIIHDSESALVELIQDDNIFFEIDEENTTIIISQINSELQEKSFANVTDISGTYSATISVQEK